MTNDEAKATFDKIATEQRNAGKLDAAATTELIREYFTNADFRNALADFTFNATQA